MRGSRSFGSRASRGGEAKKDEEPHPFAEVPCRRGQRQIELIALEAFEEAAQEPKVILEMTKQGLNSRSAPKALSHRRALCSGLSSGSSSWHQDLRAINKFSPAVTAIDDGGNGSDIGNGLGLVKDFSQSVSIVEVFSWARAATMTPWVLVIATEALVPNSYFLCSLPLATQ